MSFSTYLDFNIFREAGPGKHLSPHEFHDLLSLSRDRGKKLQSVTDSCRETDDCNSKNIHIETEICDQEMILLDVRNYYETRVGNFQLQNHCGEIIGSAIDPRTRQVQKV